MPKMNNEIILNKPEKVYIPYNDNKDYTLIPKIGEYVYKSSLLAHTKGDIKEYLFSPISGRLLEITKNDLGRFLVIENDFKEMNENLKGINKHINTMIQEDFIKKLEESGIKKDDVPCYLKYQNKNNDLIIDLLNNNYETDYYILENNVDELLEVIDNIMEINKLKTCVIIINKKNKKMIELLEQRIGTYLNFKILKLSMRKIEKKYSIALKKFKLKENYIVEDIASIYAINNILRYDIPYIDKYIVLKTEKDMYPLKVKIGTQIDYIFKSLNINTDNYLIGTLKGDYKVHDAFIIVDNDINVISI